jgi:hypothetical protein
MVNCPESKLAFLERTLEGIGDLPVEAEDEAGVT